MQPPTNPAHVLPLVLVFSALLMAGLAVAFWTGLVDVGPSRTLIAAVVALVAAVDLGLGLFFYTRSQS